MTPTLAEAKAVAPMRDWGAEPLPHSTTLVWLALGCGVGFAAAIGAVSAKLLDTSIWVSSLGLLVLVLAGGIRSIFWNGKTVLRRIEARPIRDTEAPRFINLVAGMADDLAIEAPKVWIVDLGAPNALVTWFGGPQIAVRKSLVDNLTRTEAEAVAAFCMVRLRSGEARRTTYLLGAARYLAGAGKKPDLVGAAVDAAAVALTRYPPALIAVLQKAVPADGRDAALWMVGSPKTHDRLEDRVSFLSDL